ncbi:MAG: hypothetical protein ACOX0W_00900 [Sphaerochaetaceae bacterium]
MGDNDKIGRVIVRIEDTIDIGIEFSYAKRKTFMKILLMRIVVRY